MRAGGPGTRWGGGCITGRDYGGDGASSAGVGERGGAGRVQRQGWGRSGAGRGGRRGCSFGERRRTAREQVPQQQQHPQRPLGSAPHPLPDAAMPFAGWQLPVRAPLLVHAYRQGEPAELPLVGRRAALRHLPRGQGAGVRVVALWRAGTMDAAAAVGLARAWPGALQTTRPTCLPPIPSRPRPPPPDQGCAVRGTALTAAMVATPGEAEPPAGGTSGSPFQQRSTTMFQQRCFNNERAGEWSGVGGVGVRGKVWNFMVGVGGLMVIASRSI